MPAAAGTDARRLDYCYIVFLCVQNAEIMDITVTYKGLGRLSSLLCNATSDNGDKLKVTHWWAVGASCNTAIPCNRLPPEAGKMPSPERLLAPGAAAIRPQLCRVYWLHWQSNACLQSNCAGDEPFSSSACCWSSASVCCQCTVQAHCTLHLTRQLLLSPCDWCTAADTRAEPAHRINASDAGTCHERAQHKPSFTIRRGTQ